MSNLSKEMQYRMNILVSQGKSSLEAFAIARAEHLAVSESKREHYRGVAGQQRRRRQRSESAPQITILYGRKSMVGREDASKYKTADTNPLWNPKEKRFAK